MIFNDDDWSDLKVGETETVKGLMTYVATDGLTIQFPDWSSVMIDADYTADLIHFLDEEIELEVIRTEDGLFATADAITNAIVEMGTI